jgi:hypothetical protein
MCHGLLTEPPCEASHIYGSSWYWSIVSKHGDPHDEGWLEAAEEAQAAAEAVCLAAGRTPWKVQRPAEEDLEDMRVKKTKADKAAAAARLEKAAVNQQTLKKFVVPIKTIYEESAKPPETLPTDRCAIWKEDIDGTTIWVAENGMVFACCDTTGEPAELLGRRVNGDFISVT